MRDEEYRGLETGPIRPPSEAGSLFVRVSRNCPWNKCRFCPIYKGEHFSRRPLAHVLRDIDLLADAVDSIGAARRSGSGRRAAGAETAGRAGRDPRALQEAYRWLAAGGRTVFLQDANALATPQEELVEILLHLKRRLPSVERVTAYARSQTILRLSPQQLAEVQFAGLGRIHVGFESGSDEVLAHMQKGATKAVHLEAGLRVRQAGIELSAYYMPGLGGRRLLRESALETADLVREVVPDYLRLRTLAIPDHVPLAEDVAAGVFEKADDVETVREILLFLENVGDIDSRLLSDHVLNLMQGLEGNLATDRSAMISLLRSFLDMEPDARLVYMLGRRLGVFTNLADVADPHRRSYAEAECRRLGVTERNLVQVTDELVKRFV